MEINRRSSAEPTVEATLKLCIFRLTPERIKNSVAKVSQVCQNLRQFPDLLNGSADLPTRDRWLFAFNDPEIEYLDQEGTLELGGAGATAN